MERKRLKKANQAFSKFQHKYRVKKHLQNDALLTEKNRKCSSCAATQLLDASFEKNRKGEYFKTCNYCRNKNRDKAKEYNREKRIK